MRPLALLASLLLACSLSAAAQGAAIEDFEGPNPLSHWAFSRDVRYPGASGSFTIGPGHTGRSGALEYAFNCRGGSACGAVAAAWTPVKPLKVKRHGAISLWVRAAPEVKLTLLVTDKTGGVKRYPFEVVTLENPAGDWREVAIPLAAKSTGYGDDEHTGAPEGRVAEIAIMAEPRYPRSIHGVVSFDDLWLHESADEDFAFQPDAPLMPAPKDAAQLAPRLGVNIHSLFDVAQLDRARDAGFHFVRADMLWRQVERNGAYRFAAYDRLLNAIEGRGMGALWILDYGHPQHGGGHPQNAQDIDAFARYAAAAAAHFKGRNVRYEIWNEPDIERFWPPAPNAQEYAALLGEAVDAIHRADPAALVSSGGLARIDLPFLEQTIAYGAAAQISAAGLHPYRRAAPETLAAELPLVRGLLTRTLGPRVGIWDTEWGYASYDYFSKNLSGDGHGAAGRKRQAVLAARETLTVWALGLPVAVWYDLRDDGDDAKNPDHNYGLLDANGQDKPAMTAIRELTQLAAARSFAGMIAAAPDGMHAMRLDGPTDRVFALWNDQPDASIAVQFPTEGFVSAVSLLGEPVKPRSAHGTAEVTLVEASGPLYLTFAVR